MLQPSVNFLKAIAYNPAAIRPLGTIYLADGTSVSLAANDFMSGTFEFSEASSSDSSFDIGAVCIPSFRCVLNNTNGKFDDFDFTGARIAPRIIADGGGSTGSPNMYIGAYIVEQPDSYGNTIELSCLGYSARYQRPFSDINVAYPITLSELTRNISYQCGLIFYSVTFPNSDYIISKKPEGDNLTCQQVLSYIAQMAGCFCQRYPHSGISGPGSPRFTWYDRDWQENDSWYDGGTYLTDDTPYSDGATLDGGGFHTEADSLDAGTFAPRTFASISNFYELTVATDDVVITGLRVTAYGDDDGEGESVLYGSDGYVLHIANNPLIVKGTAQAIADFVGPRVVGLRFRPFSATIPGDPTLQPGDPVLITDAKGRQYKSFITSHEWKGATSVIKCSAETPARKSADVYSQMAAAIISNKKAVYREKTARELAIQNLQDTMDSAGGLYLTQQQQEDGSVIYYLHDKPTLAQSGIVWKMTSEAFAVSVDGGKTYPFGFDAWGNAILNAIYTIGLDASYIDTGAITVREPTGQKRIIFKADVDLGETIIGGFNVDYSHIYNDALMFGADGLVFRVGSQSIAEFKPLRLEDSQQRLIGQLSVVLPSSLQVFSKPAYSTADVTASDMILSYDKSSPAMTLKNFGTLHVTGDVLFTGNDQQYKLSNVGIRGSLIEGGQSNYIGNWEVRSDGIWRVKATAYDNRAGGYLSAYGYGITDTTYDSEGRFRHVFMTGQGFSVGRLKNTETDREFRSATRVTEGGVYLYDCASFDKTNTLLASLTKSNAGYGSLYLYDPSDSTGKSHFRANSYEIVMQDSSGYVRLLITSDGIKLTNSSNKTRTWLNGKTLSFYDDSGFVGAYMSLAGNSTDNNLRLAAQDAVVLLGSDIFVGDYAGPSSASTVKTGQSSSQMEMLTRAVYNSSARSLTIYGRKLDFTKGLLTNIYSESTVATVYL